MTKNILITLFLLFMTQAVFSQHTKDAQRLQAGFNFYGYGSGIKASYDYGLTDTFSIGAGTVFFNTGSYNSGFFFFGRADYHFQEIITYPKEFDFYIGAELGLIGNGNFGIAGHIGGRYDFSNKIYGFAELGSNAAVGIGMNL